MLLKFIFVLLLFSCICETSYNLFPRIKKHQPFINVSDSLAANQDDKSFSTNLRTFQNGLDCSSSNCTELTQAYFSKEAIDVNEQKEVILSQEDSASVEILSTGAEFVSLHSSTVNQPTIIKNIQPMAIKADSALKSHKKRMAEPKDSYTKEMKTKSAMTRKRKARATTESVKPLLKIVVSKNSPFGKKQRKLQGLTFLDESSQEHEKRAIWKSFRKDLPRRKKVKKPLAETLDEEPRYFRQGNEQTSPQPEQSGDTSPPGESPTPPAPPTTPPPPPPTTPPPVATETDGSEIPTTQQERNGTSNLAPNMNVHYHYHYFGGIKRPTFPSLPGET